MCFCLKWTISDLYYFILPYLNLASFTQTRQMQSAAKMPVTKEINNSSFCTATMQTYFVADSPRSLNGLLSGVYIQFLAKFLPKLYFRKCDNWSNVKNVIACCRPCSKHGSVGSVGHRVDVRRHVLQLAVLEHVDNLEMSNSSVRVW